MLPLLMLLSASVRAAAVTFRVGFLDGDDQSPIVCATSGSDCVRDFQFPDTTRFWIEIPPTYAASIEIGPVRAGVCNTANDAYVTEDFIANSLTSFKQAQDVVTLSAKDATNSVLVVWLPNCASSGAFRRFYVGVSQNDNGLIGNCPIGHLRLRVADASGACGYRRDDAFCYEGQRSCEFVASKNGGTVRTGLSVGDGWRCCPRVLPGQTESVTATSGCTCGGYDHVSLVGLRPPPMGCVYLESDKRVSAGKEAVLYCDGAKDYLTALVDTVPTIRAKQSGTKFKVFVVDETNLRLYQSGSRFSCGYTDCANVYTDAWSRLVRTTSFQGNPLYVVIQCVSASGGVCAFDVLVNAKDRARIAPAPGGVCEATNYCRNICGITTGQCCADCSAADTCARCPVLPYADEGGSPPGVAPTPAARSPTPSPLAVVPAPPAQPSTPASTCQTGAFCVEKCRITGGISAGGVSYGSCCADCSATDLSLSAGGRCTNSCPAFGGGSPPSPTLVPQRPQATPAPSAAVPTTICSDCDCARTGCETRCMANGGGTVLNFLCNAVNGRVSEICDCQPAARTSDAASLCWSNVIALLTIAIASRWLLL
jgi:hypothetical protein